MAKVITSAEICENAKMARDMALAGAYQLFLKSIKYQSCVHLIARTIFTTALLFVLLGNYDGASIYYEALIPSMQRFTANISDPMRKGKWTMVWKIPLKFLFSFELANYRPLTIPFRFNNKLTKNINS